MEEDQDLSEDPSLPDIQQDGVQQLPHEQVQHAIHHETILQILGNRSIRHAACDICNF